MLFITNYREIHPDIIVCGKMVLIHLVNNLLTPFGHNAKYHKAIDLNSLKFNEA